MEIRQAILKAAHQIEHDANSYDYMRSTKPECGSPGCMLGWIGVFSGSSSMLVSDISEEILGVSSDRFYARIRKLNPARLCACLSASEIPAILRAYADKYHPAEKQEMPSSVRRIFQWTGEQQERFAEMV